MRRIWLAAILVLALLGVARADFSGPSVVGATTIGDLAVMAPGGLLQDAAGLLIGNGGQGFATMPVGLSFTHNIVYSGSWNASQAWVNINGLSLSGTAGVSGDGLLSPFHIYVGSDTVDATTAGGLNTISVLHATSAGSKGTRYTIFGYEAVVGTPATAGAYVGVASQTRISATLGGSAGAYSSYVGTSFGGNSNVFTTPGATFLNRIDGHEHDVALVSGASAADKYGISIVKTVNDAVRGTYDDAAISIHSQDTVTEVGWNYGISFGAYAHKWAFVGSTSTLIGIQNRVAPGSATSPANIGVDMTNGTFTTAQYKGTGFLVDPTGNESAVSLLATGSAPTPAAGQGAFGGNSLNGAVVVGQGSVYDAVLENKSAAVAAGVPTGTTNFALPANGALLAIGRTNLINSGDALAIAFTNGTRAGISLDNASSGTLASTSVIFGNSNSASQAAITLNGGSFSGGQGANALQLSNTSAALIVIGTGTEVIKFGTSGAFSANGSVATTLGSIGPVGSHTTVQKWLTITDNGATVGYLPVFHNDNWELEDENRAAVGF